MKREPIQDPQVFADSQAAAQYAASVASRNRNLSKVFATALARRGFRDGKLLDAGTGTGDVAIELARVFPQAEIIGLDLSEPLLEIARASAAKA